MHKKIYRITRSCESEDCRTLVRHTLDPMVVSQHLKYILNRSGKTHFVEGDILSDYIVDVWCGGEKVDAIPAYLWDISKDAQLYERIPYFREKDDVPAADVERWVNVVTTRENHIIGNIIRPTQAVLYSYMTPVIDAIVEEWVLIEQESRFSGAVMELKVYHVSEAEELCPEDAPFLMRGRTYPEFIVENEKGLWEIINRIGVRDKFACGVGALHPEGASFEFMGVRWNSVYRAARALQNKQGAQYDRSDAVKEAMRAKFAPGSDLELLLDLTGDAEIPECVGSYSRSAISEIRSEILERREFEDPKPDSVDKKFPKQTSTYSVDKKFPKQTSADYASLLLGYVGYKEPEIEEFKQANSLGLFRGDPDGRLLGLDPKKPGSEDHLEDILSYYTDAISKSWERHGFTQDAMNMVPHLSSEMLEFVEAIEKSPPDVDNCTAELADIIALSYGLLRKMTHYPTRKIHEKFKTAILRHDYATVKSYTDPSKSWKGHYEASKDIVG